MSASFINLHVSVASLLRPPTLNVRAHPTPQLTPAAAAAATASDTAAAALLLPCRDFEDKSGEGDMEKQARLSRFTGASSISSDAYFNRAEAAGPGGGMGGGGGGMGNGGGSQGGRGQYGQDMDLSAAELVNRLSFHVSRVEALHGGWGPAVGLWIGTGVHAYLSRGCCTGVF
jgi:hypothetical protein